MVVCKFFLQGTCKFGTYCHFQHELPDKYTYRAPDYGVLPPQQQQQQPASQGNPELNTLIKAVVQDMAGAEIGGQWLLSSYAPFKEKPAWPGFFDYSPEEIRFGYYQAAANGTLDQYKMELQYLVQGVKQRIKEIRETPQNVAKIVQGIYNSPAMSASNSYEQNTSITVQAASSENPNSALFGGAQNTTRNIFGGGGGGTAINAAAASNNIFASSTNFGNSANNIFATKNTANIFGTSAPFAAAAASTNTAAYFQKAAAPTTVETNIFAPQNNIFTQNNNANIFTTNQNNSAVNFSSSANFATAADNNAQFYSKIEDLTEDEKRWFLNQNLLDDIDNIPLKPPTFEMCFINK